MISIAPERPVATVDEFVARGRQIVDEDAERTVFRLTAMAIEERPYSMRPVYSCWRAGEQQVWGDENALVLLRRYSKVTTHYFARGEPLVSEVWCQQVEVWASHFGYQARLDDLAGLDARQAVPA